MRAYRAYEQRLPRVRFGRAGTGTIYFLTPAFDRPAGGVRVLYRHVDALNAAGGNAAVLHGRKGFRCTWFENDTRVVDVETTTLGSTDLLVVPEIYAALLPTLPAGVRHVIFNQGPFLTFEREREAVARHYATSPDLVGIYTVSRHAADLLGYGFPQRDVRVVRNAIDPALFSPGSQPTDRLITYMPRRGRENAELALELLRGRGVLDGWTVRPLENLTQPQTAAVLRESSIFLSVTYQEGFGLPAAEAMATGNLVVGFDGISGQEYFLEAFSEQVPSGDVLALARAVEQSIQRERTEPGSIRARGLAASAHVLATYSPAAERTEVVAYFEELLGVPASANSPEPASVTHA